MASTCLLQKAFTSSSEGDTADLAAVLGFFRFRRGIDLERLWLLAVFWRFFSGDTIAGAKVESSPSSSVAVERLSSSLSTMVATTVSGTGISTISFVGMLSNCIIRLIWDHQGRLNKQVAYQTKEAT